VIWLEKSPEAFDLTSYRIRGAIVLDSEGERSLYYWARLFASELGSGQAYSQLMPVIGVFILDFDELPTVRLHSVFEVRERHEGYSLCPALELHFPELPKRNNPANELERRAVLSWCQFLSAGTDEELEELAMTDPTFH
jgi:predicted transposase/invertase (TIGR01784 family)